MNMLANRLKAVFDQHGFQNNPIEFMDWEYGERDRLLSVTLTKLTENDWHRVFEDENDLAEQLYLYFEDIMREVVADKLGDEEAA